MEIHGMGWGLGIKMEFLHKKWELNQPQMALFPEAGFC